MARLPTKLRTYRALGVRNVARVAAYRFGLKTGLHPVLRIAAERPEGPFFRASEAALPFAPREDWRETMPWFGHASRALDGAPPDWHRSYETGEHASADAPWHQLPDFDPALGDIKAVWEASRFDWAIAMATRAAAGEGGDLDRLNVWLADWIAKNTPFIGPNWKCGQEASLRLLHLALCAVILEQDGDSEPALLDFVALSCRRIAPTMSYAIAQANNHGTSEAAALFVGGSWLARHGRSEGQRWARVGFKWLDERAATLILPDGSFSQSSIVYHRFMLDTYVFATLWARRHELAPLAEATHTRLARATRWLHAMAQPESGDAPNLGPNDGSRLFALTDGPYRDFRPTLQAASALFLDARAIDAGGPWDRMLDLFGEARPDTVLEEASTTHFTDGGFGVLREGRAMALLRFARFPFRPAQADVMHVDLWVGETNVLRDDGSYSYAADTRFGSSTMHNAVTFDGREPMPRVSRFLWGDWPHAETSTDARSITARHRDANGNTHVRTLSLSSDSMTVEDDFSGEAETATLRWRLLPGDWALEDGVARLGEVEIRIEGVPPDAISIETSEESRHYFERTVVPVLTARAPMSATLVTTVSF
ncbi:heparinase II/III domain-containing protein [Sphingomicrobium aestuariivivum]|uniref:heparinase II/III domain-containing protein n=1 Tax=Sphingomicrobium aestuariivivum TaxID=1582356 RepID=UPI001FD6B527|nr:heparinase II/III family protein [Sphingomicrobium aestuariivivum]MCJ8191964.1 heparinase II/III-family protein [Sphingomicrobium aestuariivivum]